MNRKIRRAMQALNKQKGAKVMTEATKKETAVQETKVVGKQIAEVDPQEQEQRVRDLITGRIKSENSVVQYQVSALHTALQRIEKMKSVVQESEQQVEKAKANLLGLEGIRAKCIEDIKHFDTLDLVTKRAEAAVAAEKAESKK